MTLTTTNRDVWAKAARKADLTISLPGGIPMFFRRIPAGSFRMGSRGQDPREEPIHTVVIPQDFYLGTFVVTQEQYRAVAERCPELRKDPDPSGSKGSRRPVQQVSWHDANAFGEWLTEWEGLPKCIAAARLPIEAEWEYACRAGAENEYYNGDGEAALAEVAWYRDNSGAETHPVDERDESHPFGLFGMHGNVWEWCRDIWDANSYRKRVDGWRASEWTLVDAGENVMFALEADRKAGKNPYRVLRGGSYLNAASGCRSAFRLRFRPDARYANFGFRVCLVRGPRPEAERQNRIRKAEPR